jgi:hypothetical protein
LIVFLWHANVDTGVSSGRSHTFTHSLQLASDVSAISLFFSLSLANKHKMSVWREADGVIGDVIGMAVAEEGDSVWASPLSSARLFVVSLPDFVSFVRHHLGCVAVVHNVEAFFDAVSRVTEQGQAGCLWLREWVNEGRVRDVAILDMLISIAKAGKKPARRPLDQILAEYCPPPPLPPPPPSSSP